MREIGKKEDARIEKECKELTSEQKFDKNKIVNLMGDAPFISLSPLRHCDPSLLDDEVFMESAISKDVEALGLASEKLRGNKAFLTHLVKKEGGVTWKGIVPNATDELKADKEFVLAAVNADGYTLQWASDSMKADKDVVVAALTNYKDAVKWASDSMKENKDVLLASVAKNGNAMESVPITLTKDRAFMLELVKASGPVGNLCQYLPKEYFDDQEILLDAVKRNSRALCYLMKRDRERFEANRELCLVACTYQGDGLEHVGKKFQADKEIVTAAVKSTGFNLKFASEELRNDPDLLKLKAEWRSGA